MAGEAKVKEQPLATNGANVLAWFFYEREQANHLIQRLRNARQDLPQDAESARKMAGRKPLLRILHISERKWSALSAGMT